MSIESRPVDSANKAVSDAYSNAGGGQDRGFEHVSSMITNEMITNYMQFKKSDSSTSDQAQYLSTANKDLLELGFPPLELINGGSDVGGIGVPGIGMAGGKAAGVVDAGTKQSEQEPVPPHVSHMMVAQWD